MKKITILGGDMRLRILKEGLENRGYCVDTLGLFSDDCGDIKSSDILIFPVPTTKDSKTVFAPLTGRKILLSEIAEAVTAEQLLLSCNYLFQNKRSVDYGSLDSYALLNAVPTAEGAIKIAIEKTDFTLWKSKVLVIGYGRVGKILADRLKSMGAYVTVSARKPADFALLEALGFNLISSGNLNNLSLDYDIIFNTVDFKVISDQKLNELNNTLLIDLSSLGGFNLALAEELGLSAFKAPGLPSRVAPKTAAEILNNTVTYIINSYN